MPQRICLNEPQKAVLDATLRTLCAIAQVLLNWATLAQPTALKLEKQSFDALSQVILGPGEPARRPSFLLVGGAGATRDGQPSATSPYPRDGEPPMAPLYNEGLSPARVRRGRIVRRGWGRVSGYQPSPNQSLVLKPFVKGCG